MLCEINLNKPDFKNKRTELSAGGEGASLTPAQVSRRPRGSSVFSGDRCWSLSFGTRFGHDDMLLPFRGVNLCWPVLETQGGKLSKCFKMDIDFAI